MSRFKDIAPEKATPWLVVPADWRRPMAGGSYDILWDRARAYGQIWPRPNQSQVAAFYDVESYYTHSQRSIDRNLNKSLIQRAQTKLSWLADKGVEPDKGWWEGVLGRRKLRILEVGCGNGSNLSMLSALGHEVVGVEPDAAAIEVARDRGHIVFEGTAEALPTEVSSDRFDALVFMHVLEHCIDPSIALENAVSLLNKGGRVVAEVPNNECRGVERFGELWHWLDVPRHLNFFTEESLCALFSDSGLSVDGTLFRGYCRQFSDGWKTTQLEIARAFKIESDKRVTRIPQVAR